MTRLQFLAFFFAVQTFALCGSIARGQTTLGPPSGNRLPEIQIPGTLPADARIRLVLHGGRRILATDPAVAGDSMVASIQGSRWTLALADIDTVWVRRGTWALLGAATTGVPSAIYGAALGAFLATDPDSNGKPGQGPRGAIFGGALFGALGALPGAFIGSLVTRWKVIYVRRAPSS